MLHILRVKNRVIVRVILFPRASSRVLVHIVYQVKIRAVFGLSELMASGRWPTVGNGLLVKVLAS